MNIEKKTILLVEIMLYIFEYLDVYILNVFLMLFVMCKQCVNKFSNKHPYHFLHEVFQMQTFQLDVVPVIVTISSAYT